MSSIDERSRRSWRARVRVPGHKDKTRSFNTQAEARSGRITEAQLRSGADAIPDAAAEPTLAWPLTGTWSRRRRRRRARNKRPGASGHGRPAS